MRDSVRLGGVGTASVGGDAWGRSGLGGRWNCISFATESASARKAAGREERDVMSAPTSELGRDKDVSDGSASALVDADVLLPGGDKECPAGDGALCWVASCAVKRMPHSLHGDPGGREECAASSGHFPDSEYLDCTSHKPSP